jgi:hypothetical protein
MEQCAPGRSNFDPLSDVRCSISSGSVVALLQREAEGRYQIMVREKFPPPPLNIRPRQRCELVVTSRSVVPESIEVNLDFVQC